jgi:hypothetical protein
VLDLPIDSEKREALQELQKEYAVARKLGLTREPHANLEWILGARRDAKGDPSSFEPKNIEVVTLWLHDLALELDRRLTKPLDARLEETDVEAYEARQLAAQKLRDATDRFLHAFRSRS